MSENFNRGVLTDYLIDQMTAQMPDVLIGDNATPDRAGWPQGANNIGAFKASVTVLTGSTRLTQAEPSLGRVPWGLEVYYDLAMAGAVRAQCDDLSFKSSEVFLGISPSLLDGWKMSAVLYQGSSPINVNGPDPKTYSQTDSYVIKVHKGR